MLFSEIGMAYIEINGTQMLSENSFLWSNYNDESTQSAIQRVIQRLAPVLKLNVKQVYLSGSRHGALHAANLIAKYLHFYAGALLIAPKGVIQPVQPFAAYKRIVVVYYDRQHFSSQALLASMSVYPDNSQHKQQGYHHHRWADLTLATSA